MYLSIWLPTFLLYFCSLLLVGLRSQLLNASHIRESRPFQSKVIDLMRKTDICWAKLSISCFGRQSTKQETKCGTFMWQAMANHKFLVNLRLKLLIGKVCFFFWEWRLRGFKSIGFIVKFNVAKIFKCIDFSPHK